MPEHTLGKSFFVKFVVIFKTKAMVVLALQLTTLTEHSKCYEDHNKFDKGFSEMFRATAYTGVPKVPHFVKGASSRCVMEF